MVFYHGFSQGFQVPNLSNHGEWEAPKLGYTIQKMDLVTNHRPVKATATAAAAAAADAAADAAAAACGET